MLAEIGIIKELYKYRDFDPPLTTENVLMTILSTDFLWVAIKKYREENKNPIISFKMDDICAILGGIIVAWGKNII